VCVSRRRNVSKVGGVTGSVGQLHTSALSHSVRMFLWRREIAVGTGTCLSNGCPNCALCCQQGGLASGLFNDAVETDGYWVIACCCSVENFLLSCVSKYKDFKIHRTTVLEDGRNSCTFSLTSALNRVSVNATPRPLYPYEIYPVLIYGMFIGPQGPIRWCVKSPLNRDSIPEPPRPVVRRYTD
jgi:hypothetical protein